MEREIFRTGIPGEEISHVRWCSKMSGREWGRMHAWGHGHDRKVGQPVSRTLLRCMVLIDAETEDRPTLNGAAPADTSNTPRHSSSRS